MAEEALLTDLTAYIQTLAIDQRTSVSPRDNNALLVRFSGVDSPAKRSLESELAKLTHRIHRLESQVEAAAVFPETPNDGS